MKALLKSFLPLIRKLKLKRYLPEIILLTIATIITIASSVLYLRNTQNGKEEIETSEISSSPAISPNRIFVDVSGAVKKPNIYQINFGARIKEVVDKAGGLSDDADIMFFNRNFNLSRIVSDQEKIYIPSISEINSGAFIQNQRTLDYFSPTQNSSTTVESVVGLQEAETLISVNSATIEELDQLPGVGQVTANKIITNRPYSAIDELLTKKVINKNVFEKIKNLVNL